MLYAILSIFTSFLIIFILILRFFSMLSFQMIFWIFLKFLCRIFQQFFAQFWSILASFSMFYTVIFKKTHVKAISPPIFRHFYVFPLHKFCPFFFWKFVVIFHSNWMVNYRRRIMQFTHLSSAIHSVHFVHHRINLFPK